MGPAAKRLDWLEEALTVARGILARDTVTHDGPTYHFSDVHHAPQPQRRPLPMRSERKGNGKGSGSRARFADIWQTFVPLDGLDFWRHKDKVFQAHCAPWAATRPGWSGSRYKLIIRSNPAAARTAFERLRVGITSRTSRWEVVSTAAPEQVAEALAGFRALGVQSFLPQLGWPYDQETFERSSAASPHSSERATAA